MPSPFATHEDHAQLWFEQSNYISTHVSAVGYGIHVVIYVIVMYYIIQQRHKRSRWIGWLIFNSLLFAVGTINLACSIKFNEDAWINEREYPGGPYAFMVEQQSRPILTLGNTASILAAFMADGLLVYRAMIVWQHKWYIMVLPILFYIASIILSIMTVIQLALPSTFSSLSLSFPVWIVLMCINISLSVLIAARILLLRRTLRELLGKEYAGLYTSTAAIIIESALPFTIISIILLGLFGRNDTAQNLFVPLLVQIESIAPELIILRVMLGRGWSTNTMTTSQTPHTIVFVHDSESSIDNEGHGGVTVEVGMQKETGSETSDTV